VQTLGQTCFGIATVALLIGSGAGFAAVRLSRERARECGAEAPTGKSLALALTVCRPLQGWRAGASDPLSWAWCGGALVGIGALLLGLILRGVAAGPGSSSVGWWSLTSGADRAALVALLAALLSVGSGLRRSMGWAGLIPVAVIAGVGAVGRPAETWTTAPFLLVCTLVAAGLGLWSAGQGLDVLLGGREDNLRAATVAFAGLTVSVVVVGGANWRVWGTPGGVDAASVSLLAAWLTSAARLILGYQSVRLISVLDLLVGILLVVIALNVQWTLPFD
jgi:hypothetical protein